MKLQKLTTNLILHDSSIEVMQYDRKGQTLVLEICLCNYMQANFTDEMPESSVGKLRFSKVTQLSTEPTIELCEIDGQILEVNLSDDLNTLTFVLLLFDHISHEETCLLIHITSENVVWEYSTG